MKLFERIQIGKWDQATLHRESLLGIQLMERAATALVVYLLKHYPHQKFQIFCGNGNNGGDGLAIARLLHFQKIEVKIFLMNLGTTSPDFQLNLETLNTLNIPILSLEYLEGADLGEEGVIVDALLGTGARYPLPEILMKWIPILNSSGLPIISLDMPSGIPTDLFPEPVSYPIFGIKAFETLFLEIPKLPSFLPEVGEFFGKWNLIPLGLDPQYYHSERSPWYYTQENEALKIFKTRNKFAYKGDFGHSLIIAGSYGKAGAALLCTQACIASGSGLVSTLSPEINAPILQIGSPESMFLPGGGEKILDRVPKFPEKRYNSIGLGPGIGMDLETRECILHFIKNTRLPLVLDADALNILASDSTWKDFITPGSILTPHVGEFNRLTQGEAKNPYQRLKLALDLASSLKIVVILKGANTAVVLPNKEVHFNSTGNPGMATGGSGDVLTGILTGLLAQGYTSEETAILGVYIHGRSGDLGALDQGQNALKAGDLCKYLGPAFLEFEKLKNSSWPAESVAGPKILP